VYLGRAKGVKRVFWRLIYESTSPALTKGRADRDSEGKGHGSGSELRPTMSLVVLTVLGWVECYGGASIGT
jgi:hypothetical protein